MADASLESIHELLVAVLDELKASRTELRQTRALMLEAAQWSCRLEQSLSKLSHDLAKPRKTEG